MNSELNADDFIDLQGDLKRLQKKLKRFKKRKNIRWQDRIMIHVLKDLIKDRKKEIFNKGRYVHKRTGEYYSILPQNTVNANKQLKIGENT